MKYMNALALIMGLALAISLCGCSVVSRLFGGDEDGSSSQSSASEPVSMGYPVEAGGVRLLARPDSVVSLSPSMTEKLADLALDSRLVGVSDYCEAGDLPACGTAPLPDTAAILSLQPDLVVAEGALPEDVLAELEQAGVPVAVFSRANDLDALLALYTGLACLLEGQTAGQPVAEAVENEYRGRLDALNAVLSDYTAEHGRKTALYLRLLDFTVATGDTLEHWLMEQICLDNLAGSYTGWNYPEEAAKSAEGQTAFAEVDMIFMDETAVTIKDLEQNAFYRGLPATIQDRYLYISSLTLERQSLRMLDELERMAAYAYPDAGLPTAEEEISAPEEQQE